MRSYLSFIKFAHTIFALPFALVGFFIALHEPESVFNFKILLLVLLCMVFARSAAMAFNRFVDRELDAHNARTQNREIPTGRISPGSALTFSLISAVLFVACTFFINTICFVLSPVALLVILGYSYTKRFTALSHFILGLGLSFAPIGAYLAVTAQFDVIPILLGVMVMLWVGGFDILYALQDRDFDSTHALHSIPALVGTRHAIIISAIIHGVCALLCIYVTVLLGMEFVALGWLYWVGTGLFLTSLGYQHLLVKPHDLSRINLAFFTTNGIASVLFGTMLILDFYI